MKQEKKRRGRKRLVLLALFLVLTIGVACGFDVRLAVRHYELDAPGLERTVCMALITDLHSCAYGEGQRELIDAVENEHPDLIALVGDIFDDELPDDNTRCFLEGIAGRYPCYYVTGNHEYWAGEAAFAEKMRILEETGVRRLSGEAVMLDIGGYKLALAGVDDPDATLVEHGAPGRMERFARQLSDARRAAQEGSYRVLLSHRPELTERYEEAGFDVVLCGHAHGGQWRLLGLINGIYAPGQGFFPKFAGGLYDLNGTAMIVSRGLARESTRLPRFCNRPEVVMVTLG